MQLSTRRETRCARLGLGFRAPGSLANRSRTLPPHDVLPTRPASPSWQAGMCICYVYADSPTHLIYLETLHRKSTDVHVLYWERLGKQASARRVAAVRHAGAAVDARAGSAPARAPGGHRKTVKAPSLIMSAPTRAAPARPRGELL